jgi:hypothetical protein
LIVDMKNKEEEAEVKGREVGESGGGSKGPRRVIRRSFGRKLMPVQPTSQKTPQKSDSLENSVIDSER